LRVVAASLVNISFMRIGFLVHRRTFYKYYAPLIEEALRRRDVVFCLHDFTQPSDGPKGYDFPVPDSVPQFQFGTPQVLVCKSQDDFLNHARTQDMDVWVSLNSNHLNREMRRTLRERGINLRWVTIQHASDILQMPEELDVFDQIYLFS